MTTRLGPVSMTGLSAAILATLLGVSCSDSPKKVADGGSGGSTGDGGADSASGGADGRDATTETAAETGTETAAETAPGDGGGADTAPAFPAPTCSGVTSKTTPITLGDPQRKVYCALDLGSNNIKLQVLSMEPNKPLSFKDERQCRTRLGFGAKVFDSTTMTAKPLAASDVTNLIAVMKEFQQICTLDGGTMAGAEATQWARDATNIADVKAMVKTATTLDIEVLTPEQEGQYGYVAGTRNAAEKFSLDPGSNSFQIGWLPKGATTIRTASVPFGYVRAAAKHYPAATADTYDVARAKHAAEAKMLLNTALAALTPPTDLAALKASIVAGDLKPELFIVGQDGALHLSVRAQLRDAGGVWISDKTAYDTRVAMEQPMANASFGDITTILTPTELTNWFSTVVKPADFMTLRTAPVREVYGEKSLANAVLLDMLTTELGLTTIVLVPQEMPAGYILAKVK